MPSILSTPTAGTPTQPGLPVPKWFVEAKVSRQLPSPTGVALTVLRLTEKDDAHPGELARALQADPALAGRVLKYANSVLVAPTRPLASLPAAVTYLGMRCIGRLALGFSLVAQYRNSPCRRFDHKRYWSRSLAAGVAAQLLNKAARGGNSDEIFACGLLSEVGALALATVHSQAYDQVLAQCEGRPPGELYRLERRAFSADQIDLSAVMIKDWGLPEHLVRAVQGLKPSEGEDAAPHEETSSRSQPPSGFGLGSDGAAGGRHPSLTWVLRVARQVALYCTASEEERADLASSLLGMAGILGMEAAEFAGVVAEIGREWQTWGQAVDVSTAEVPGLFSAASAAPFPFDPSCLKDPAEDGPAPFRVLIADSDPVGLAKLAAEVRAAGYNVLTAPDGQEALHKSLEIWPEIILVGSLMAAMDGLALCRLLRKSRPGQQVYVILLIPAKEAGGVDDDVVAAFDAGADDYCLKPWNPRVLAARLRAGQRAVQLQRALEQEKEEVRQVAARLTVEQSQLEEQLRQAQKMDAIGRLAGGVAHDFNNLLTVINGFAQLVAYRLPPGDGCRAMIDQIAGAGERAASLTRQLLTFSRKTVVETQVLDLNAVISESEKLIRRLVGEEVELTSELSPALGRVLADPGQVDQVLLNLVINGRDAMTGNGKLTIRTEDVEITEADQQTHGDARPGPHVLLSVCDTGSGMTEEVKAHIFEPFFTTKEKGKGTGLGLAVVYGIVKQSGGHIRVESEVGRGTTFKIYLPHAKERTQSANAPSPTSLAGGQGSILLVEDEEGVRSLLSLTLREAGYQVLEAANGREALRLLKEQPIKVGMIVTDVVMPQMGGPQLVAVLKEQTPGIKVIYISGHADDAVLRAGTLDSATTYLQKPFTPAVLTHKIQEVLGAGGG